MSSSDDRRFVVATFDMEGLTTTSAEVSRVAQELAESGRFLIEIVSTTTYVCAPYEGRKGLEYPNPVLVVVFERIELGDPDDDSDSTKH